MKVRCPNCEFPIELVEDVQSDEISCPSCGSQISLVGNLETMLHLEPNRWVNHFRLLQKVGRGQFGSVWKAHDEHLDRIVAVKIPHARRLSESEAAFFYREARTAAQLQHPHIVSILEVGLDEDTMYIVSQFIDGLTLRDLIRLKRPSATESTALCVKIARALHYAHEQGIVHRDLKPSNILVDAQGEPHITDFGLAKRDVEATIAVDGQILGTPAYMSPEQARGDARSADRRADVWALGVILYELLTGQRPFHGSEKLLLLQIANDDPTPPRRIERQITRDLQTICLKALAKKPDERYQSAGAMADDLESFLRSEPIQARETPLLARGLRWIRRRPAASIATLFGIAIVALLPLLLMSLTGPNVPTRAIVIDTVPSQANLLFVPLDDRSSRPDYRRAIRAKSKSPVTLRLPPGEYLVVAYRSADEFHEVYRHVPAEHEQLSGFYVHQRWESEGAVIRLPTIRLHRTSQLQMNMRQVSGGQMNVDTIDLAGRQLASIPAFLVDPYELRVGDLLALSIPLPPELQPAAPPADHPITHVSWDYAVDRAEQLGKRLLDEVEHEYLATAGGRQKFPWGDSQPTASYWTIGPAGTPAVDQLTAPLVDGPVFGLCSNALEWTSTPWAEQGQGHMLRVFRGGPALEDADLDRETPRYQANSRAVLERPRTHPRLGLRYARSARPPLTAGDRVTFTPQP